MSLFDDVTEHNDLESLRAAWDNCTKCPLRSRHVCHGQGKSSAKVVIVGQNPTVNEGFSGQMMTDYGGQQIKEFFLRLASVWGMSPDDLYFTNVCKCPSTVRSDISKPIRLIDADGNRGEEVIPAKQCAPYLEDELGIIKPKLIISIGAKALKRFAMFDHDNMIPSDLKKARGKVFNYHGAKFTAITMPIAITDIAKSAIQEDYDFLSYIFSASKAPIQPKEETIPQIDQLFVEVDGCQKCGLCKTATKKVFGTGSLSSKIMFVGEAPGATEDQLGSPFVGDAGKVLRDTLSKLNVDAKDVYITNTVKCLAGSTKVILADGTTSSIQTLVKNNYRGEVRSADIYTGKLVNKKVYATFRNPLGERTLYKLTTKYAKRNSKGIVGAILTEDHEVLTSNGWTKAKNIYKQYVATNDPAPDYIAKQVIIGSILGDGHISTSLSETHCAEQTEYVKLKVQALSHFGAKAKSQKTKDQNGNSFPGIRYTTKASRYWRYLRDEFYKNGRKIVADYAIDNFGPMALAVLYMDDGSKTTNHNGLETGATIATNCFSRRDVNKIIKAIKSLGIKCYAKNYSGWRIVFDVENARLLFKLISKFVPPCLRYKITEFDAFDNSLWKSGPAEIFWDEAKVIKIKDKPKTVYCLAVEDTENFMTLGGIVHNCWPGQGNPTPQPENIDACLPYLQTQIKTIRPKVIVALGNVALGALTKTPLKISRARGNKLKCWFADDIIVVPSWHPSYVLRNKKPGVVTPTEKEFFEDIKIALEISNVDRATKT